MMLSFGITRPADLDLAPGGVHLVSKSWQPLMPGRLQLEVHHLDQVVEGPIQTDQE